MLSLDRRRHRLVGPQGSLQVPAGDQAVVKLMMLIAGQCLGLGGTAAAQQYRYSKARYFQLLKDFARRGLAALTNRKRGPAGRSRRTNEAVRQVIVHRFLDPEASVEVIAQKVRQQGLAMSVRSVRRVLDDYHLQKKTLRHGPHPARRPR